MSNASRTMSPQQIRLEDHMPVRETFVPTVRPSEDAELEDTFVRAAAAWARWRQRTLWQGR